MNHSSWSAVYAGEETAVQFFNSWKDLMIRTIPPEKLLVYNVAEGWEPLATLLGVEVPDEPFPKINDGGTIMLIVAGGYYILVIVIPILLLCLLFTKSSKFRNTVVRIFGLCCRKPVSTLYSFTKKGKSRNNNNNNNNSERFDYVKYSSVEA